VENGGRGTAGEEKGGECEKREYAKRRVKRVNISKVVKLWDSCNPCSLPKFHLWGEGWNCTGGRGDSALNLSQEFKELSRSFQRTLYTLQAVTVLQPCSIVELVK
jgi:hypothetical protein